MVYLLCNRRKKLSLTAHPLAILRPTQRKSNGIPSSANQAFSRGIITLELSKPHRIGQLKVTLRGITTVTCSNPKIDVADSDGSSRKRSSWFDNQLARAYASLPHQHVHFEREVRVAIDQSRTNQS
jgi:hypothetical protein